MIVISEGTSPPCPSSPFTTAIVLVIKSGLNCETPASDGEGGEVPKGAGGKVEHRLDAAGSRLTPLRDKIEVPLSNGGPGGGFL